MYVQKSEPWNLEQCCRQNSSVRDDDSGIGTQIGDRLQKSFVPDLERLMKRKPELFRLLHDFRSLQLQTSPGATIGLRNDEHDVVLPRDSFERRNSELRSA